MKDMLKLFILVVAIWSLPVAAVVATFTLSGCQTIQDNPAVARLAVEYATLKAIDEKPDRAARVAKIAGQVRANAEGGASATVALIRTAVLAEIRWDKLDQADALLIRSLIDVAAAELEKRVGDGLIDPEQRLIVAEVAGWIESAALAVRVP